MAFGQICIGNVEQTAPTNQKAATIAKAIIAERTATGYDNARATALSVNQAASESKDPVLSKLMVPVFCAIKCNVSYAFSSRANYLAFKKLIIQSSKASLRASQNVPPLSY